MKADESIMALYTLTEAAQHLGIDDPRKLRRLLTHAGITATTPVGDKRRRMLSEADVARLRAARDDVYGVGGTFGLLARLEATEARLSAIEGQLATLATLATLTTPHTSHRVLLPGNNAETLPAETTIPPGSVLLGSFATPARPAATLQHWMHKGLIEVVSIPNPQRPWEMQRWLTPRGQAQARDLRPISDALP